MRDDEFQDLAEAPAQGFVSELWGFLRENKKWWLLPIVASLVLVGALVLLGGTAAAPFIYTLF